MGIYGENFNFLRNYQSSLVTGVQRVRFKKIVSAFITLLEDDYYQRNFTDWTCRPGTGAAAFSKGDH